MIVDYYSNFIEVEQIRGTASRPVIQGLNVTFGRHGIPDCVVSDNGPSFASAEFQQFAKQWEFNHITTSPHYPQSNGKAKSAVKICKTLMKKAKLAKSDIHLALLNHRNTPTKPTNLSPAQRLFGRRTRTQLQQTRALLTPETPHQVPAKLASGQHKQAQYYNRTAKPLKPLKPNDPVQLKIPGSSTRSRGICTTETGDIYGKPVIIRNMDNQSWTGNQIVMRARREKKAQKLLSRQTQLKSTLRTLQDVYRQAECPHLVGL